MFQDNNGNWCVVIATIGRYAVRQVVPVLTLDVGNVGYVVDLRGHSGGEDLRPDDTTAPCCGWFGPGEAYPDWQSLLEGRAVIDGLV